ncbi:aminoglycoside 6-adenylyltransferase [Halalkalibacterium halodurans]|uniref:aminoglycoside 6-adenylyltransferase n=1 Tax=Halalkalibacterium halodurans TaxID=86665 RepID=UPI002AAA4C59|nr:aminoglycoside 6-adenylyltransferase [Halalkalibacterium halodurans]MDY7220825.1 aminoglycoside 6-adenylyltransferase [Halalkalibacterium halodurans]MDY7240064.1 aminoglycoside 6-adenylyltransferase [Halalkalibacterium halodurans]MED4125529.1 aminoglycoside 6-adenylyltransferase [Halalkalibacterium halodurans]
MRTEQEMMDAILTIAKKEERIRVVYMNGSRTNSNVPKDLFQDYDIVYVVTDIAPFIQEQQWLKKFGEPLMIQEPDQLDAGIGINRDFSRRYAFLMLFTDGNRIDLTLQTKETMREVYENDTLTVPLLDKDHCLPPIPPPSDSDYHVKEPTEGEFISCTNNFWWCLQNVAKGIWRDELPYAKQMFELTTRASLDEMVNWWIGLESDFQLSTGKLGKYFKKHLPPPYWAMYEATYANSDYEQMWESIFIACDLFRTLAKDVAAACSFTYPETDDRNMTDYLHRVKNLSADATDM